MSDDYGIRSDAPSAIDKALVRLRNGLERPAIEQSKLAPPDEAGIVPAPLAFDDASLALATDLAVLAIAESLLGGYTVLGHGFSQARWHRDLPYQHFTSPRPIALSALFCLDPFSTETGTRPRWAVKHVYGRGFVAPQIDLPDLLGDRFADEPTLARLLGYGTRPAASLPAWWARAHGPSA